MKPLFRATRPGTARAAPLLSSFLRGCATAACFAALSGCAWWNGHRDPGSARELRDGMEASRLTGQSGMEAVLCARRYAELNWANGLPAEVGDASLAACASELARYTDAVTTYHSIKIGLAQRQAGDAASDRMRAARWAEEDLARKRTEVRSTAIRRSLELRRSRSNP